MLEKNKNCIEFSMRSMMVTHKPYQEDTEIGITGMIPGREILAANNPFDIPCEVVMVPKREFERLQADNQHHRELAKQREENYKALLDKTGFYNLADLMCYLPKDKTLKDIIDGLAAENEGLIKKLQEPDPFAEYKELLEKLHSKEDVEKFEWTLNHICGGKASANGWMVTAKLWRRNYETLSKLIGFSSVEEIQDYLTNEAECDTLHEAISKLHDQVKYTCDEWYNANSSNNSWKAAAECNSPKELIEKLNLLRDDISGRSTVIESYKRDIEKWQKATGCLRPEDISTDSMISKSMANEINTANEKLWRENEKCEKEIGIYSRALNEWKEVTGCPSPSAAKTLIESGASWMTAYHSSCEVIKTWKKLTGSPTPIAAKTLIESGMSYEHGYHEVQEENRKLTEEVDSWKNVTGYSTPKDYMHARISGAFHTPFDYTAAWQTATGCTTPEQAKERIKALNERIDESEADYNHLLCTTGFESEGEIEDALDKCDHSTLRKALVDYEFDYENLLKLTGYKSEHDIRVLLNDSEQFVYENMRELINSLKRKVKFTDSNWQKATGCDTPERAEERIKYYKSRLGNAIQAASCASKHLDNITF